MSALDKAKKELAVIARLADGTEAGERAYRAYREIADAEKQLGDAMRRELLAGLKNAHAHCMKTMAGDHGAMTVMRLEQAIDMLEHP